MQKISNVGVGTDCIMWQTDKTPQNQPTKIPTATTSRKNSTPQTNQRKPTSQPKKEKNNQKNPTPKTKGDEL